MNRTPVPSGRLSPWAPALIVAGGLCAYANSFHAPFVFDDIPAIVENPALGDLGSALGFGSQAGGGLTLTGRPALALTLALNHAVGDTAVVGYHVVNVGVHLLAGLVLLGLIRHTLIRVSSLSAQPRAVEGLALAIAFLWTVHPLQTESVTYVVQRAEALMGLFYLLTLYGFVRGVEASPPARPKWWGLSLAACAVGMATKEVMVTAPVVVWFYDRTFVGGTFVGALRQRARFYAGLAATWAVLAVLILSTGANRGGTVGFNVGVTPWAYAATQFEAVTRYLQLSVWPAPLVFDYGTFWVKDAVDVLGYAAVVLAVLAATLVALRRWPVAGFVGACFFGILSPTSLTPGTIQMIVEHRMYLPLAAVLATVVVGLYAWLGRIAFWLCGAAGLACVVVTWQRNADYRSGLVLWEKTVAQRPHNAIAHTNLGLAYFLAARVDDALREYRAALRENPASVEAHFNLAIAEASLGRTDAALAQYEEALRLRPAFAAAHNNLGNLLAAAGRSAGAARHYEEAVHADPGFAEPLKNLGGLLLRAGRGTEALARYEAALKLDPASADTHYQLGNALAAQDRLADAITHYEQAARLQPNHADTQVNWGNALLQLDRVDQAAARYEAALRLAPRHADAHNNLGVIFLHTGRVAEAVGHFEQALAVRVDFPDARRNLAEARAALAR